MHTMVATGKFYGAIASFFTLMQRTVAYVTVRAGCPNTGPHKETRGLPKAMSPQELQGLNGWKTTTLSRQ